MASPSYPLNSDETTLSPLSPYLHKGLIVVSSFGCLSFVSSTTLFFYLTYRFISWARDRKTKRRSVDRTNQLLVLIYNLLLADIQQGIAFSLNVSAVAHNAINIYKPPCWAQGWFISTGDLASGVWILAIAMHSFLSINRDYKIPQLWFYVSIALLWIFVYVMALIGVALHPHDIYVRAGAWCWINSKYDDLRLWLHYLWIFICMFGTVVIYAFMILSIQLGSCKSCESSPSLFMSRTKKFNPPASFKQKETDAGGDISLPHIHPLTGVSRKTTQRATKYLIMYPLIYVVCTIPLAAGRMAAMTGVTVSDKYFCVAGAMMACNGWLDVLLYGFTRGTIIFGHRDAEGRGVDAGRLESFMWYYGSGPTWRDGADGDWGTVTVIEGGGGDGGGESEDGTLKMNADGRRPSGLGSERGDSNTPFYLARKASSHALSHLTRKPSTNNFSNSNKKKRRGQTASTEDLHSLTGRGAGESGLGGSFMGNEREMLGGGIKTETTVDVRIGERRGGGYELRDVGGIGVGDPDKVEEQHNFVVR